MTFWFIFITVNVWCLDIKMYLLDKTNLSILNRSKKSEYYADSLKDYHKRQNNVFSCLTCYAYILSLITNCLARKVLRIILLILSVFLPIVNLFNFEMLFKVQLFNSFHCWGGGNFQLSLLLWIAGSQSKLEDFAEVLLFRGTGCHPSLLL